MTSLAIYFVLFIIPIFILTSIIVKLLLNNFKMTETRLLSIALLSFCFVLLGSFLRYTSSFQYVPFYTSIVIGLGILVFLSTLLHLVYVLLVKYCHLQTSWLIDILFYMPVLFHVIALSLGFRLSADIFYKQGLWIYQSMYAEKRRIKALLKETL
ncbi:hypothetical protein [Metasolibacillus sp. FSL K6-0083]|uniref:hypothetical protein n=1 Tax=Metasolibacillus sp. FSL K6-0083 TaxID=2921416 RepID=UPI00315A55EE